MFAVAIYCVCTSHLLCLQWPFTVSVCSSRLLWLQDDISDQMNIRTVLKTNLGKPVRDKVHRICMNCPEGIYAIMK